MPQTYASLAGSAFILLICAATAIVGERRERAAAFSTVFGLAASQLVQHAANVWDPVLLLTAVDVAVLVAFVVLAWKPRRGWSVWAVGIQGVTVALDLLHVLDPSMTPYTYLTAVALLGYALAAVIAYAGWTAWTSRLR